MDSGYVHLCVLVFRHERACSRCDIQSDILNVNVSVEAAELVQC